MKSLKNVKFGLLLINLNPLLALVAPLAHRDGDIIGRKTAGGVQDMRRDRVWM